MDDVMGLARIAVIAAILLQFLCWPASAQEEDLAIEHQGIARHVLLHVPSPPPSGKLPLVIYLHGIRPKGWKNHTQREIDTLADRDGVLARRTVHIGNDRHANRRMQSVTPGAADGGGGIERFPPVL
jgi:poly(3-hydroxybutyrate) depolymerase